MSIPLDPPDPGCLAQACAWSCSGRTAWNRQTARGSAPRQIWRESPVWLEPLPARHPRLTRESTDQSLCPPAGAGKRSSIQASHPGVSRAAVSVAWSP